ncbi:MAG: hypothetical protein ACREV9_00040 [Burkholderiales bacterium]
MAGQIKKLIDNVVQARSKGNIALATITRAKLALKGINPDKYTDNSPDDAAIISKLQSIADDFNVRLGAAANDAAAARPERTVDAREAPRIGANVESRMSELRHKYAQREHPAERLGSRFSDLAGTSYQRNNLIEEENQRLRSAVADLQIEIQMLKEILARRP